jgi:hypothetical protein
MESLNSCGLETGCKRGRMMLPCADSIDKQKAGKVKGGWHVDTAGEETD